ncbi:MULTISPECIES: hypothetical protein [unclassified Mycobacterium]|uniref:hypothetical protein n=1 Tax=unclassified Mycobacterium TaxID=2642494 RepID=UPI0029C79A62|nr:MULTISPECIES: hypothetical protein [unclassified Mycobacterium]
MATTLGVAVATRHVALVLIGQREAETVTLDEVLLDSDFSTTTPPADVRLQVLAEVKRISAVLDAHKRPLSQVAVAATEPAAARTAARVVEALTNAGVRNARAFAPRSSGRSLANRRAGNIALPSGLANGQSGNAAVTAAHEIAREALARDSDDSGRALSWRTRHAMALAATALATICVGLIGFRALSAQSKPEVTPVEATDPVPTEVTHRDDPPPPTSAVNTDPIPPAIVDTPTLVPTPAEQAEVAAPSTLAPTVAPTQNSPPTSVEPTPTPLEVVPPESPQAPEPAPVTTSQAPAEPPVPPPPSPPSTEPPPPTPAPAVPPSPEPAPPVPAAPQANPPPP